MLQLEIPQLVSLTLELLPEDGSFGLEVRSVSGAIASSFECRAISDTVVDG